MPSLEGERGKLEAPLLLGASHCRQTQMQGHTASQSKAPSWRAWREGVRVNLSGWPHSLETNEGFVSRTSHQRLKSPLGSSLPSECCLRGGSRVCCAPAIGGESASARQHQGSPGSVSSRHIRVMNLSPLATVRAWACCSTAGSSHSLPRSQEPQAVSKQSLFSEEVC